MNSISLTLCASTRTGCLSAAISACAEVTLTLAGDLTLPSGTSLALLTPRGTTLAHTILSEQAAPGAALPLSTLTAQAAEYTRSCRAGDTREALLAIGDSEHPIALVPARIAQNPLYTLAPPTAQAPAYPTSEALHALLAEIQAAALRAENAQASATSAQSKAEAAQGSAEAAATSASDSAKVAASSEQAALTAKQAAEASQVQAKASETAAKASETSAKGAEKAASASETAAKASEQAAAKSATAAAASANAAKASEQAAASSSTSAAKSAASSATSANAAANSATAAGKSATSAAASATAAAGSATDLAEAVATAESLDKRITSIEAYGVQFKEDKRLDTTGLTYPLVKQNTSPFSSVYGPNGVTCRYSCNCFRHVLNDTAYNKAYLYSSTGVYQGMLTNTGIGFNSAHGYMNCFCLVSTTLDFHYTVFNGYAYNNNKMIISKFSKEDGCPLLRSRQYSKRGVEGSIWQGENAVGPVVWNVKTGHILVFGDYYTNVYNDSGTLVDKHIGYGYLTFDEDLNFVKWDAESDAFVSSETYDETFLTLLPNSPANAVTAYWIFDGSFTTTFPTVVATTQNNNTTNGLGYLGTHDEIVPITLSSGPYYNAGLDFVPLGGSRLSVDSTGIISSYAPYLMMSSVNSDAENSTVRVIKLFNGSMFVHLTFKASDNEDGFTYTYRRKDYIKSTEFAGVTISSNTNFQFLHGKYVSTYDDVGLFLYYNGFIYDRSGKYTKCQNLSFPRNNRDCSPQRGMYARSWQIVLSPVGGYKASTGGVRLDM